MWGVQLTYNDVILSWTRKRILKSKNIIIMINGSTGSGKSWAALAYAIAVAKLFDTHFTVADNIGFKFSDLLRKTQLPDNGRPGTPFIFEEVGSFGGGASSRDWQSKANRFFFSFLQTTRHRQQILIFTCPSFGYLDKGARELCHMQWSMAGIDFNKQMSYVRPSVLQVNAKTGKIYFKLIRYKDKDTRGVRHRLTKYGLPKPPPGFIDEYEEMKHKFTSELNKKIIDADDKENEPKKAENLYKPAKRPIDYHLVDQKLKQGLTSREIAYICRCSVRSIELYKKLDKKAIITNENSVFT